MQYSITYCFQDTKSYEFLNLLMQKKLVHTGFFSYTAVIEVCLDVGQQRLSQQSGLGKQLDTDWKDCLLWVQIPTNV